MKKKGFTLIETMVVIGVVGLLLPAIFSVIFGIMREQIKIFALREVKRQGDLVLNNMETNIKSYAQGINSDIPSSTNSVCDDGGSSYTAGQSMYFRDSDGNYFHYFLQGNTVTIEGTSTQVQILSNLTTNTVKVSNVSLSCNRTSSASPPIVSVAFDISYSNGGSVRSEDNALLHYQTKIKMNNY